MVQVTQRMWNLNCVAMQGEVFLSAQPALGMTIGYNSNFVYPCKASCLCVRPLVVVPSMATSLAQLFLPRVPSRAKLVLGLIRDGSG